MLESIRLADEWIEEQLEHGSFVGIEDQGNDTSGSLSPLDQKILETVQLEPMNCERLATWAEAPHSEVRNSLRTLYQKDLIKVERKDEFMPVFRGSVLR